MLLSYDIYYKTKYNVTSEHETIITYLYETLQVLGSNFDLLAW